MIKFTAPSYQPIPCAPGLQGNDKFTEKMDQRYAVLESLAEGLRAWPILEAKKQLLAAFRILDGHLAARDKAKRLGQLGRVGELESKIGETCDFIGALVARIAMG